VLASPADDTILGAAIILPDHPRLAPESRGNLFDGTEIEEALLLHVHALSDAERAEIAGQDEAVRAMIDRASATGAQELMQLHGLLRPVEPEFDPRRGEDEAVVDGVTFRRGAKVVPRLADRIDPYDRMLDGRPATVERIYLDYEGRVYLGVTVDSDPMQEIMRDSGRYLFFFPEEVELVAPATTLRGGNEMSDEQKGALGADTPVDEGAGQKGLGVETGSNEPGSDVLEDAPERRGEVRFPDVEDPDEHRPTHVPVEGGVEEDPSHTTDAAPGAKD
jgi:hypothetical protein